MSLRIRAVSDLLEPCEAKVSSTVLRGEAGGDSRFLPGSGGRLPLPTRKRGATPASYPEAGGDSRFLPGRGGRLPLPTRNRGRLPLPTREAGGDSQASLPGRGGRLPLPTRRLEKGCSIVDSTSLAAYSTSSPSADSRFSRQTVPRAQRHERRQSEPTSRGTNPLHEMHLVGEVQDKVAGRRNIVVPASSILEACSAWSGAGDWLGILDSVALSRSGGVSCVTSGEREVRSSRPRAAVGVPDHNRHAQAAERPPEAGPRSSGAAFGRGRMDSGRKD